MRGVWRYCTIEIIGRIRSSSIWGWNFHNCAHIGLLSPSACVAILSPFANPWSQSAIRKTGVFNCSNHGVLHTHGPDSISNNRKWLSGQNELQCAIQSNHQRIVCIPKLSRPFRSLVDDYGMLEDLLWELERDTVGVKEWVMRMETCAKDECSSKWWRDGRRETREMRGYMGKEGSSCAGGSHHHGPYATSPWCRKKMETQGHATEWGRNVILRSIWKQQSFEKIFWYLANNGQGLV